MSDRFSRRPAPLSDDPKASRSGWYYLLGLLAVLIGVTVGYPMLNEDAGGPCRALEFEVAETVQIPGQNALSSALLRAMMGASGGEVAASAMKSQYPRLPAVIGCTAGYWQVFFNPQLATTNYQSLLNGVSH